MYMLKEFKRKLNLMAGHMPLESGLLDDKYEEYWNKRETTDGLVAKRKNRIRKRMLLIAEEIDDHSSILDIGCGNGELLAIIAEKKHYCSLTGIDISREAVERTQKRGIEAIEADIMKFKLENLGKFDYIIMSEIIEHLPNPERILLDLKKIAKKIIITTPNVAFILFRLRLFFFGNFPVTTIFHIREHLSLWSVKDFIYWANFIGFDVTKIVGYSGVEFLNLKKLVPNLFANHMLYVLEARN